MRQGFIRITQMMMGARDRWTERAKTGLDDKALKEALAFEIGELSGFSGRGEVCVNGQGCGPEDLDLV